MLVVLHPTQLYRYFSSISQAFFIKHNESLVIVSKVDESAFMLSVDPVTINGGFFYLYYLMVGILF